MIIKGISVAFMYVSSKLVLFVTIISHCLIFGGNLDAKTLFMSMAMLNNVQFTMTQLLPRVVSLGVESLVSLKRITDFLLTKEFLRSDKLFVEWAHDEVVRFDSIVSIETQPDINKLMPRHSADMVKRTAFIECQNVGARWPSAETKTLEGLFFRCDSPGLVMVCGQVASGKSSLFMSLLNELPISDGKAQIRGSYGFCSQTAWIFSGTVKDNIIFGSVYNENRYRRIVEVCALERDLELFEFGDSTYINENSLSGGQKARINLARCLYRDNDIYLLDDPFSAIDNRVSVHIFEKGIREFLSGKLVILATNQIKLLKRSDKILLLDQGKQLAFCSYNELSKKFSSTETSKQECFGDEQMKRLSFLTREFSKDSLEKSMIDEANIGYIKNATKIRPKYVESDYNYYNLKLNNIDKEELKRESIELQQSINGSLKDNVAGKPANKIDNSLRANNFVANKLVANRCSGNNSLAVSTQIKKSAVADKILSAQNEDVEKENDHSQNKEEHKFQRTPVTEKLELHGVEKHGEENKHEKQKEDDEISTSSTNLVATSESLNQIHAPYGSMNLSKNEDKTLITITREAVGHKPPLSNTNSNTNIDTSKDQTTSVKSSLTATKRQGGAIELTNSCCYQGGDGSDKKLEANENRQEETEEDGCGGEEEEKVTVNKVDTTNPNTAVMANEAPLINKEMLASEAKSHYRTSVKQVQNDGEFRFITTSNTILPITIPTATASNTTNINTTLTKPSQTIDREPTSNRNSKTIKKYNNQKADDQSKKNLPLSNGPVDEDLSVNKLPGLRVWFKYYTQTSVIRLVIIILTFLITQALFSTIDIYLTVWSLSEQNKALVNEITGSNYEQLAGFKHQLDTYQQNRGKETGINDLNKTMNNLIEYDKIINGDLRLLLSFPLLQHNQTDCSTKIAKEIQKVSISPLSSRSSQIPFVIPMNNFFVPIVTLFHSSYEPIEVTRTSAVVADGAIATPIARTNGIANPMASSNNYPNLFNLNQFQQKLRQQHQVTSTNTKTTSSLNQNLGSSVSSNVGDVAVVVTTSHSSSDDDDDSYQVVMVDRNISEESEAALNVKSIYRPLYLFVNNFTSGQHALTYTVLLIILFSCSAIANVLSLTSSNKSAIALYKKLTDNALFAKISFFDVNPIGRFLNRATRDIGIIDEAIPYNANQAYDAILQTVATFIVVAAVDINLALPSLIILFIFLIYHSIHVKPTKDIQRLEGISRSPIISHISTTLTGLHTIRATKSENRFEQMFMRHQDAHTSVFLLYLGCNRSMAVILDSLNATYTGIIAFWAVISGLAGPSSGLILTSAMLLSGLTQHGIMKLTETESLMTSVERVIEYCSLPQEENYDSKGNSEGLKRRKKREEWLGKVCLFRFTKDIKNEQRKQQQQQKQDNQQLFKRQLPPTLHFKSKNNIGCDKGEKIWPNEGCIEYKQVDLYYNKLEKPVLKNISFKLKGGEKIGVIGRTGAGKSSVITTLFRLYDFDGTILIDGVDIKQVDLLKLRTSIGVIPQQPVLFSNTVRQNLDPLNLYDDFSIWAALDKAHLRTTVSALPGKLNYNIGSCGGDGGGFSSGQKQLICLARVLLRQCSIIVMDEATANVDPTTDAIIQTTIRREFKHCTVITIAHRLETVLDYDRIMVLEAGRIVDFDTPEQLAARKNSYFINVVHKSLSTYDTADLS